MRVLIVSTKTPWPPVDGGRLLLLQTIEALCEAGDDVTLVAPVETAHFDLQQVEGELTRRCRSFVVESETLGVVPTVIRAEWTGTPLTIVRHSQGKVRDVVEHLIRTESYDVVHAEQQQAVVQTRSAIDAGIPVVLRAQNVESRLWVFAAHHRNTLLRPMFLREARRLAAWEGRCVDQATVTVALTDGDAEDLVRLSSGCRPVVVAPPPFPARKSPGTRRLEGSPAVAILASRRWIPNRDAVGRFVAEAWPRIHQLAPEAMLHVFGIAPSEAGVARVAWHPPPENSADAFPEGGVVAIPSRHPTGIPMKGLEGWARGLPVAASREAADQLGATDGEDILVADTTEQFARAIVLLAERPELGQSLAEGASRTLARRFAPPVAIARLRDAYEIAVRDSHHRAVSVAG
jgi:hypothetical protein